MSAPTTEQALRQLDLAYGKLTLPDWQQHAAALAEAVEGLSELYLHVDATTGVYHIEPIYLDPQRVVLGLIPAAVEPLVQLLVTQTRNLDLALANGWLMPDTEAPAWAHWHERLHRYVLALEQERGAFDKPSERLWREVTAPLLQGIFPEDFAQLGIANPSVRSKPDVSTVPTTAFMVALQSDEVDRVQVWLLSWREAIGVWLYETRAAIASVFSAIGSGLREGGRKVGRTVAIAALVGGLTFVGWQVAKHSRRRKQSIRAEEQREER